MLAVVSGDEASDVDEVGRSAGCPARESVGTARSPCVRPGSSMIADTARSLPAGDSPPKLMPVVAIIQRADKRGGVAWGACGGAMPVPSPVQGVVCGEARVLRRYQVIALGRLQYRVVPGPGMCDEGVRLLGSQLPGVYRWARSWFSRTVTTAQAARQRPRRVNRAPEPSRASPAGARRLFRVCCALST